MLWLTLKEKLGLTTLAYPCVVLENGLNQIII